MDNNQKIIVSALNQYSWSDSKRLRNILADIIPAEKLLVRLMVLAYDEGIYELSRAKDINIVSYKFVKILMEDCGISEENAFWVVETWRYVFGITSDFVHQEAIKDKQVSFEIVPTFLSASNRYSDILKLQKYVNQNDTAERECELLSLYYGVLVNPIFETSKENVLWLANKCLQLIEDLIEKCSVNHSVSNQYRVIRFQWIRSFIYMMNGQYSKAYDNYRNMIKKVDNFLENNDCCFGGCYFMYYLTEVNMHVLAEAFGVEDEDFFVKDRYEIAWFKKKCSLNFEFIKPDGWMLGTMTVNYENNSNPFWTVFKSDGSGEASGISYNLRTLKICENDDEKYLCVSSMGNGEFLGNNSPYTWKFPIISEVADLTRDYITNNKYIKENDYIHNCMENDLS